MPTAHKGSCLYACVDYDGNYMASIGCDGHINIYKLNDLENI